MRSGLSAVASDHRCAAVLRQVGRHRVEAALSAREWDELDEQARSRPS